MHHNLDTLVWFPDWTDQYHAPQLRHFGLVSWLDWTGYHHAPQLRHFGLVSWLDWLSPCTTTYIGFLTELAHTMHHNLDTLVRFPDWTGQHCTPLLGKRGHLSGRTPDSWSKGRGFESRQERRKNFLLQGQLSVLTLISVSVPPPCYRSST